MIVHQMTVINFIICALSAIALGIVIVMAFTGKTHTLLAQGLLAIFIYSFLNFISLLKSQIN